MIGQIEITPGRPSAEAGPDAWHQRDASERQRIRKAQSDWSITHVGQQIFVRHHFGRLAVEHYESLRVDLRPMNPFEASGTIENKSTLEKVGMRRIPDEAAILVDVANYVLGEDAEQRQWCFVQGFAGEANIGLVGTVTRDAVIGDPAAELSRKLLNPAIAERNVLTPHEGITIGRHTGIPDGGKVPISFGSRPIAWRGKG